MDVCYAVAPYWNEATSTGHPSEGSEQSDISPYASSSLESTGMPNPDELLDRYAQITGFDPRQGSNGMDWEIAKVFHHIRGGTITHGIHARTISGQASSDFSHMYFENTKRSLDAALNRVRALKENRGTRTGSKL